MFRDEDEYIVCTQQYFQRFFLGIVINLFAAKVHLN